MTALLAIDALREAVERIPADRLSGTRAAALQQLQARGTPSTRHEDWKYTNLDAIIDVSNRWLVEGGVTATPLATGDLLATIGAEIPARWIVIANGEVDADSMAAAKADGIHVALLSESDMELQYDAPLADLNTALLRDGLVIRVDADFESDRPVGLLIADDAASATGVSQARIEIDVAANATASFVEYHVSTGSEDHFENTVINLHQSEGSNVSYVRLQQRNGGHSQTGRLTAVLGRDSSLNHAAFDFGGRLIRNDLHIELAEPGCSANLSGLYLADDEQHIDNHTRVDHRIGPARSKQEYRGILAGSSRCVWNGKAIVHDGADGTDAEQANHNLLLSDRAEIDAKPELEIYADDVKCAHGTTIGQLDENAMYYLRTRGIGRRQARQLLTRAFAQSIVAMVPIESAQDAIGAMIAARLGELTDGDAE